MVESTNLICNLLDQYGECKAEHYYECFSLLLSLLTQKGPFLFVLTQSGEPMDEILNYRARSCNFIYIATFEPSITWRFGCPKFSYYHPTISREKRTIAFF